MNLHDWYVLVFVLLRLLCCVTFPLSFFLSPCLLAFSLPLLPSPSFSLSLRPSHAQCALTLFFVSHLQQRKAELDLKLAKLQHTTESILRKATFNIFDTSKPSPSPTPSPTKLSVSPTSSASSLLATSPTTATTPATPTTPTLHNSANLTPRSLFMTDSDSVATPAPTTPTAPPTIQISSPNDNKNNGNNNNKSNNNTDSADVTKLPELQKEIQNIIEEEAKIEQEEKIAHTLLETPPSLLPLPVAPTVLPVDNHPELPRVNSSDNVSNSNSNDSNSSNNSSTHSLNVDDFVDVHTLTPTPSPPRSPRTASLISPSSTTPVTISATNSTDINNNNKPNVNNNSNNNKQHSNHSKHHNESPIHTYTRKTPKQVLSDGLIIHFHGGGFVAHTGVFSFALLLLFVVVVVDVVAYYYLCSHW